MTYLTSDNTVEDTPNPGSEEAVKSDPKSTGEPIITKNDKGEITGVIAPVSGGEPTLSVGISKPKVKKGTANE